MCILMEKLETLSTAEEYFDFLDVPYERSAINFNRAAILRHFHQYLRAFNLEDFNEYEQRHLCRAQLSRAYHDFVRFTPAQETVLKVFKHTSDSHGARDLLHAGLPSS